MKQRAYGVEIEVLGDRRKALRALKAAGVNVYDAGYSHKTSKRWKIVEDGSVGAHHDSGFELVSPILYGKRGLAAVRRVAAVLAANGFQVDRTCGLHVHVDARDLKTLEVLNVFDRYAKFERDIDALMPPSRRDNDFCRRFANVQWSYGDVLRDMRADVRAGKRVTRARFNRLERYAKVNLASYAQHGTIEFRQHSGTILASKIEHWIQFCVGFVEASRDLSAPDDCFGRGIDTSVLAFYAERAAELAERSERRRRSSHP